MPQYQGKSCPECSGKGWHLFIYPQEKPRHVYWFQRGPAGERAIPCPNCDGAGDI
jgi:DNA-directed RNA polymerase subunit RPC12/RpoP